MVRVKYREESNTTVAEQIDELQRALRSNLLL